MTKRVLRCAWCHKRIDGEPKIVAGVFKLHSETCAYAAEMLQMVLTLPLPDQDFIGVTIFPGSEANEAVLQWELKR